MQRNSRRVFLWFITASIALHAFLFAALPALVRNYHPLKAQVLDVVLLHPKPLLLAATEPKKSDAAPSPVPSSRKTVKSRTSRQPQKVEIPVPQAPQSFARETPADSVTPTTEAIAPALDLKADVEAPAQEPAATLPPVYNAAYLRNPPPRYPLVARRNGEQGTVTLKVLVTREGIPASVAVDSTSGSSRLDNAAAETVRTWRFVPARRGTQPVEAWVRVPIVFRLERAS